jgi:hypothetical protein
MDERNDQSGGAVSLNAIGRLQRDESSGNPTAIARASNDRRLNRSDLIAHRTLEMTETRIPCKV